MRPEPELSRSILDAEVAQRDIGDEVIGEQWMVKAAVLVCWLPLPPCIGEGGVGSQPVPDWLWTKVAMGGSHVRRYVVRWNITLEGAVLTHLQPAEGTS